MKLENLAIGLIAAGLRKKEFSAEEVVIAYLEAISKRDREIHSYLFVADAPAREAARAVDKKISAGEPLSALAGVPLALKDNLLVKDLPATAGSKILEPYIASYDSTVAAKLKAAGAVILGKTNMDEFAQNHSP